MQTTNRPIVVAGAHRTGTTWVGKMLSANRQVAYIREPLNVVHRPGVFDKKITEFYAYICAENEAEYLPAFTDLVNFRYHFASELAVMRSPRDLLRMLRDSSYFLNSRLQHRRPLLKDPFAVFSAPWFVERMNAQAVITIRHPAGFASSLKRLKWPFDFAFLLRQPLLVRDYLEPYCDEMRSIAADDVIGQASLLWKMIYQFVHEACEDDPSIHLVRHEDLSLDPVGGFRKLYEALGLDFTPGVEQAILASSGSDNPSEGSTKNPQSVKLNSRANVDTWKRRLSAEEIERIYRLTEGVIGIYYPEAG